MRNNLEVLLLQRLNKANKSKQWTNSTYNMYFRVAIYIYIYIIVIRIHQQVFKIAQMDIIITFYIFIIIILKY